MKKVFFGTILGLGFVAGGIFFGSSFLNDTNAPSLQLEVVSKDSPLDSSGDSVPEVVPIASSPDDTSVEENSTEKETVTVPVRIHMLQSDDVDVQTTLTNAEMRDIFESALGVNAHYWKQANIEFEIESIVKATPRKVSEYASNLPSTYGEIIDDTAYRDKFTGVIQALTPTSGLLENGFNVVVVHDFGIMGGGIYLSNKIVYVPERSAKGTGVETVTFSIAHELGHALGLVHYDAKVDPYNLMAISNPLIYNPQDKIHLTAEQIDTSYRTARTGTPTLPTAGQSLN